MPVQVSAEVREAVAAGAAVVALESTIITHGLPQPHNLDVALEAEQSLRDRGVVPATVGVVEGRATVGLTHDQLVALARGEDVDKVSVRDLPVAAVRRRSGGTTVAATAYLSHAAGLRVFATGGLGGVHRGAAASYDESADLPLLARTPILVVSAGVKSILDIPASLERMETLSITVVGYRTTRYPAFYVADSGLAVEHSIDSPAQAAELVRARDDLGLAGAVLLANPVAPESQLDPAEHDRVLRAALAAAEQEGVAGKATTPFLLDRMQRETGGRSLEVNLAVYRGNVALAGEIALALAG